MGNHTCRVCSRGITKWPKRGMCSACYQRFMRLGYETPRPLYGLELFWSKVEKIQGGCWLWTGMKDDQGYGKFGDARSEYHNTRLAHRIAYIEVRGPFDPELTLDHLCHTHDTTCSGGRTCPHRGCVNPDHLEPVTNAENCMRGLSQPAQNARQSACSKCGQPFDVTLKNGWRMCSPCQKARMVKANRRVADRRKAEREALRKLSA